MIQFKNINITNFLSVASGDISLTNRGLLLISGENKDDPSANSNGAGKSSVVDAICWCLYGQTARGVTGDAVINRAAGKGTAVAVSITEGSDEYVITRYRKHKTGKSRLTVLKNNSEDLTLGTDKLTQELVERIIGCSYEVFRAAVYAGQESMPNLPGMTDKELKKVVEEAAGIELLERAYDLARERSSARTKEAELAAVKHSAVESQVERGELSLAQLRADEKEWESKRAERVDSAKANLREVMESFRRVRDRLQAMDRAALEAAVEKAQKDLRDFNNDAPTAPEAPSNVVTPSMSDEFDTALRERDECKHALALVRAKAAPVVADIQQMRSSIANMSDKIGQPCGECGKTYCEEDLHDAKLATERRLAERLKELAALKEQITAGTVATENAENRVSEIMLDHRKRVEAANAENEARRKQHQDALSAHRAALQQRDSSALIAALNDAQGAIRELEGLVARAAGAESQVRQQAEYVKQLQAEPNPITAQVDRAQQELDQVRAMVADLQNQSALAEELAGEGKALVELFGPKGIRGEILDTVTPFLNQRTGDYLNALSDGNIVATWNTIGETAKGEYREKFHIGVQHSTGSEGFDGLSGGEKRKVRLATAMALQDLVASRASKPIRLFIADEVDDALDVSGLERLLVILEEKARAVGTVLIISHNSISDWCRNEVVVCKQGGVSTLEERS